MKYQITFTEPARKALDRLNRAVRLRVFNALQRLAVTPTLGKPLQGPLAGCRSYRIGDWRIVYEIHEKTITILIVGVGHRREIYQTISQLLGRH